MSIRLIVTVACICLAEVLLGGQADSQQKHRQELLNRSLFKIVLPATWRVKEERKFEDDEYYVFDGSDEMFFIYFGNNPDLVGLHRDHVTEVIMLNGASATEFRKDTKLTDIIVELRCGGPYRYAWLARVSMNPVKAASIKAAMRSLSCANVSVVTKSLR